MGSLKINVHRSSIKTYPNGEVVPKSFDPNRSGVGEAAPARLVMRQENTHRLILNTIIYKSLAFQKKPSNTSVQLMFMAMEAQEGSREAKPIQMLLKVRSPRP